MTVTEQDIIDFLAEKVMGWTFVRKDNGYHQWRKGSREHIEYSHWMPFEQSEDALQVIERIGGSLKKSADLGQYKWTASIGDWSKTGTGLSWNEAFLNAACTYMDEIMNEN